MKANQIVGLSRLGQGVAVTLICLSLIACKQNGESQANQASDPPRGTQAILKTQQSYDVTTQNQILGDYTRQSKVEVPPTLSGQNKWLMFEGPVLENDKVAYRYYADKRHRFDIYGKKVSNLVMDTVSWDYHNIMDWGSDILKVGNSLGIGSPAILYQDSVYCLESWDSKEIEVITSGGPTSTVRTTFYGLTIGDEKMTIQQDWSLSTGDYASTIKIKRLDGNLPDDMLLATGIVKHLDDFDIKVIDGKSIGYNWGTQSYHQQDLGMAIISDLAYSPRLYLDDLSHVIAFDKSQTGVEYQFLSVWADGIGGIDTKEKFVSEIKNTINKMIN